MVFVLVARVVAAEAHPPRSQGFGIDLEILGAVVARQLQQRRLGPKVLACVGVRGRGDRLPGSQTRVGSLAVVGVAAALAQAQTVDRARDQRRLAQVGNRSPGPGCRGNELEVRTSRRARVGPVLITVVQDAVRVEREPLEREAAERAPAGDVGGAGAAAGCPGHAVEDDVRGLQGRDDLDHLPGRAVLLAHQDRAPGRTPHGVTGDGAAEDRLHAAVGKPDPLDSGMAGVFLVTDDEVRGVGVVWPERDHVDVGSRVRVAGHDPHVQAPGHRRERGRVGLGRRLIDALRGRLLQGLLHSEEKLGSLPEVPVTPRSEVEPCRRTAVVANHTRPATDKSNSFRMMKILLLVVDCTRLPRWCGCATACSEVRRQYGGRA